MGDWIADDVGYRLVKEMTQMNLTKAYRYCARETKQAGSSFYYGMRLLPAYKRQAMFAIYAWSRMCDDAVDDYEGASAFDHLAQAEQIYREAFAKTYTESSHPVVVALGDTVRRFQLPSYPFADLLRGMRWDIDGVRIRTFDELEQYCEYVAGTIGILCVYIFGYREDEALSLARDMGIALQLTNVIRDLQEDVMRGRIYLPQDEMEDMGYSIDDLSLRRATPQFYQLMQVQVERAKRYYDNARNLFPLVEDDALRCLRVLYMVYRELLQKIEDSGYDVLNGRIQVSGSRKLQLVWGALWNAPRTVL